MERIIQIAIDGPAGAGKSTVAKKIAEKLNILYLDTGAMYRSVTYCGIKNHVRGNDDKALKTLFENMTIDFAEGKLLLNGKDISAEIRTPEVETQVSEFAANPLVREKLVEMQRKIAAGRSVVMEGRDIGTVVLKDTPHKFFLNATVEIRANRRLRQNQRSANLQTIKQEIERRDRIDSSREKDPLSIAPGSTVIDTSELTLDEVVALILKSVSEEE
ncbi:MAG: (d)CMP kinase [Anaerofustis sp.]